MLAYTSDAQDITADPKQVPGRAAVRTTRRSSPRCCACLTATICSRARQARAVRAARHRALARPTAQRVMDLRLPGIYTQATTQRQYPGRTTAANVIGTVHSDGAGAAGIEAQFNTLLAGHDGTMTYSVDNLGNVNPSSRTTTKPAQNGATVKLTIDQSLQYIAQQYLDTAVPESGARGAQMAVLDVHTGQVLALASSGTFDAADPNTINPNVPINPPVMSAFEPGSVQKAITFAAALQQKHDHAADGDHACPTRIHMGGVDVSDAWYARDRARSPRPACWPSRRTSARSRSRRSSARPTWYRYEKLFGVGTKTGIELPGESSGYVPPLKDWSASTFANLPFGQGESMTVLQLASIYQTIANNGVRIPPRIVQSVTKSDGVGDRPPSSRRGIRVIDPATVADAAHDARVGDACPAAPACKAAIPGYRVAGKTGTAQQPDPNHGGALLSWMNWDTFAGMVPADDPQFVVAIMVDNPAHGARGRRRRRAAVPPDRELRGAARAHPADRVAVEARAAAGLRRDQDRRYLPANVC